MFNAMVQSFMRTWDAWIINAPPSPEALKFPEKRQSSKTPDPQSPYNAPPPAPIDEFPSRAQFSRTSDMAKKIAPPPAALFDENMQLRKVGWEIPA
jgi:hypothetical protein